MPRDAFSNYTLPAGNPIVTGTIIASSWANTTLNDIATALSQSLSTDGSTASVSLAGKTLNGGSYGGVMNLVGGRIQFPVAQVPSSNGNTLDDYEEGTFTPTLSFGTPGSSVIVPSTAIGSYTKVGDLVTVQINYQTSSFVNGSGSGTMNVGGLPFPFSATKPGTVTVCGVLGGFNQDAFAPGQTNQLALLGSGAVAAMNVVTINGNTGTVSFLSPAAGQGVPSNVQKTIRVNFSYKV